MADSAVVTNDGKGGLTLTVKAAALSQKSSVTAVFDNGTQLVTAYTLIPGVKFIDNDRTWTVKSNDGATLVATASV